MGGIWFRAATGQESSGLVDLPGGTVAVCVAPLACPLVRMPPFPILVAWEAVKTGHGSGPAAASVFARA